MAIMMEIWDLGSLNHEHDWHSNDWWARNLQCVWNHNCQMMECINPWIVTELSWGNINMCLDFTSLPLFGIAQIVKIKRVLRMNEISKDFSLRSVLDIYLILHSTPGIVCTAWNLHDYICALLYHENLYLMNKVSLSKSKYATALSFSLWQLPCVLTWVMNNSHVCFLYVFICVTHKQRTTSEIFLKQCFWSYAKKDWIMQSTVEVMIIICTLKYLQLLKYWKDILQNCSV